MKNIKFIFISSLFIFFTACHKPKEKFTITANLSGFPENSKVIISNGTTGKVLDSTKLVENKFVSTGFIENPPIPISIIINPDNNETAYSFIFIGNENVKISGNKDDFPDDLSVIGSKHQEFKTKLDNKVGPLNKERNQKIQKMFSLRQEGKWNDSLQNAYWSKEDGMITKIDSQTTQLTKDFIADNINSDYALSQLVIYKTDFSISFIKEQLSNLSPNYKNSKYAQVLKTFIENEPLDKGNKFYDFTAENQNGQSVKFSNFFKDKYVLLEFHSPYCSWSGKALSEIKMLSEQMSDSLKIVTFSVDENKEDWLKEYKTNQVSWTSLYNENGRYSDVYTKYQVFATPTYYLFEENGTVVEKWDGYNENLIEQIKERIKNGG
ncbi:hypothetical protein GCM10007103_35540 [Salinimicrobium marinum]|uniref:Thioredoxin domain-containing protein n=1 Tax=Salinimicrobium marinum TaxID=680283 RepID=A0A918SMR8_9FLAO|nr:TlpA disulfide reductase family protein [Salinimicrobium marinum]GHA52093.1 hypothetical protein GCM10007103_35540 [Salinimicrobium marinum]